MREVANVPVEQPLRRVLNGSDITKTVEHRESITVLQGAQRTIDERGVGLDLVFGPEVDVSVTIGGVWLGLARGFRHSNIQFQAPIQSDQMSSVNPPPE